MKLETSQRTNWFTKLPRCSFGDYGNNARTCGIRYSKIKAAVSKISKVSMIAIETVNNLSGDLHLFSPSLLLSLPLPPLPTFPPSLPTFPPSLPTLPSLPPLPTFPPSPPSLKENQHWWYIYTAPLGIAVMLWCTTSIGLSTIPIA